MRTSNAQRCGHGYRVAQGAILEFPQASQKL